jgi:hypothetical protein
VLDPASLPNTWGSWTSEEQDQYTATRRTELLAFSRLPAGAKQLVLDYAERLMALCAADDARPTEEVLGDEFAVWRRRFEPIVQTPEYRAFHAAMGAEFDLVHSIEQRYAEQATSERDVLR